MLQKTFKKRRATLLALALIPLAAVLLFSFSQKKYVATIPVLPGTSNIIATDTVPKKQYKLPQNIKSVGVRMNAGNQGEKIAEIEYKDGQKVTGDVSTPEKERDFETKYGVKLPPPPPTPQKKLKPFPPPKVVKEGGAKKAPLPPPKVRKALPPKVNMTKFTPPKIVNDDEVKVTEVTISEIKQDPKKKPKVVKDVKRFAPPKIVKDKQVKRFPLPKVVKDDEVKVTEVTISEIKQDTQKEQPKIVEVKRFPPPKVVKDEKVQEQATKALEEKLKRNVEMKDK